MIQKILYVAFRYEYGIEENGDALNKKAFYDTFYDLGFDVDSVFFEDYDDSELQNMIIKRAESFNPDMIFFILQKDQIKIDTLLSLKKKGYFTVNFFGDDNWRFDNFSYKYANFFSACLTNDKFAVKKYINIGQKNIIRTQWASLEPNVTEISSEYEYDVSFIGGASYYRRWFVDRLKKNGIHVNCFGIGWEKGRVDYDEVENIIRSSKINLNISNSAMYDIRYLFSNIRHFINLFRTNKNKSEIKARLFELPVQGGFQLTEYVPTCEEYFDLSKDISCYASIDEAIELIKYYLDNDHEREKIKLSGIEKARSNHMYKNRINEFMIELNKIKNNNE